MKCKKQINKVFLKPTCDSTATLLLTRSVVVIATAAESALQIKLTWLKRYPLVDIESEDCNLIAKRRRRLYSSTESDVELTSVGSASRSSFCKTLLEVRTLAKKKEWETCYTFFILWPITPVDSINTSSGFTFSSCNDKETNINSVARYEVYRRHGNERHHAIPSQENQHNLTYLGNQHHPENEWSQTLIHNNKN